MEDFEGDREEELKCIWHSIPVARDLNPQVELWKASMIQLIFLS